MDTSALLAILFDEPPAARLKLAVAQSDTVLISAASYVEAAIVVAKRGGDPTVGWRSVDGLISDLEIQIVPFDELQARTGIEGRLRFGKGFGVRGGLNMGDSFAYGFAKHRGLPLLFVGDDFTHTDIVSALP